MPIEYYAGTSEERFDYGPHSTRAAAAAEVFADDEAVEVVFTGRKVDNQHGAAFCPSANSFLDQAIDKASDNCGEVAEGWLNCVTGQQEAVLQNNLNSVFATWLSNTNNRATFFSVVDIEEHEDRDAPETS